MTVYGPVGTLVKDGGTNVVTFTRTYNVTPQRLWRALTTREGIQAWLAPRASIDARVGGKIELTFDEDNTVSGVITAWDPHRVFAHTWVINDEVASEVRFELTPSGADGTTLSLVHRGLPDEMCRGYAPGWHAYLVRLESATADVEPPDWMDVFVAVASEYGSGEGGE